MNLEKRGDAAPPASPAEEPCAGKKPVIIYILILFVAAFLLMSLSLLMHQRDNTEAIGQLREGLTTMQDLQATQQKIIELQEELDQWESAFQDLKDETESANDRANLAEHNLERTQEAMDWFWQLEAAYLQEDWTTCETILGEMERNPESPDRDYLSDKARSRYEEIQQDLAALAP